MSDCLKCKGSGREIYRGKPIPCNACWGSGRLITHAFIGKKSCGCVTALRIEIPDDTRGDVKFMKDMLASGRSVDRVPLEESRRLIKAKCECA